MHNKLQFFFRLLVFNNLIFCSLYSSEKNLIKNNFARHAISAGLIILNPRSVATDLQARELAHQGSKYIVAKIGELPEKSHELALTYPKTAGLLAGAVLAGTTNLLGISKRDAAIVGVASGSGAALLLGTKAVYNQAAKLKEQAAAILVQAKQQCIDANKDLEQAKQDKLAAQAKLVKSAQAFKLAKILAQGVSVQKQTALGLLDGAREHNLELASSLDLTEKTQAKSESVLACVRGNLTTQPLSPAFVGGSTGGTGLEE